MKTQDCERAREKREAEELQINILRGDTYGVNVCWVDILASQSLCWISCNKTRASEAECLDLNTIWNLMGYFVYNRGYGSRMREVTDLGLISLGLQPLHLRATVARVIYR